MRKYCDRCEIYYDRRNPSEAKNHAHPEPKHGLFRIRWLESKMPYDQWIAETREGQIWRNRRIF